MKQTPNGNVRATCSLSFKRLVEVHCDRRVLQCRLALPLEAVEEDEVVAHVLALSHQVLRLLEHRHSQPIAGGPLIASVTGARRQAAQSSSTRSIVAGPHATFSHSGYVEIVLTSSLYEYCTRCFHPESRSAVSLIHALCPLPGR